ncbi:hypothetical protein [Nocardia takedensis]|uniref:hypothetical protein n=1 Tax=Nocardia takedensis TaxID=259390 RepID=UPI0014613EAA|nr:hypothetical protein [Nocardia takedensis]
MESDIGSGFEPHIVGRSEKRHGHPIADFRIGERARADSGNSIAQIRIGVGAHGLISRRSQCDLFRFISRDPGESILRRKLA